MLADPVKQRVLEADVLPKPLRFNPFVPENLLPFGQKLLIKTGLLHKLARRRVGLLRTGSGGQVSHGNQRDEAVPTHDKAKS